MIYQVEKVSDKLIKLNFAKGNLSFFAKSFTVDEFLNFDFSSYIDKNASIIAPVLETEKLVDPSVIEQIGLIEQKCIEKKCVILFTNGIFNPLEGLEVQIKQKDKSLGALLEYKHVSTLIWWGEFNKDLALEIGEVDVLIGEGKVVAQLVEIANPMQVIVTCKLDEFSSALGATDIEETRKIKLNIKPEQKETAGLKIVALAK